MDFHDIFMGELLVSGGVNIRFLSLAGFYLANLLVLGL